MNTNQWDEHMMARAERLKAKANALLTDYYETGDVCTGEVREVVAYLIERVKRLSRQEDAQ